MFIDFFLLLIILGVALLINNYISEQFYEAACAKGYDDRKYFWIPFFFGITGYLLIIALPTQAKTKHPPAENDWNIALENPQKKKPANPGNAKWEETISQLSTDELITIYTDEINWSDSYRELCRLELTNRNFDFNLLNR